MIVSLRDSEVDMMYTIDVDANVVEALGAYVALGLQPGSFTTALLMHDMERAYQAAHHMLKPENNGGRDIVANMMHFTKVMVPEIAQGSPEKYNAWVCQRGYQGASDAEKVQIKLLRQDEWWSVPK